MAEASGRGEISSDEGSSEDESSYYLHFDMPDNDQTWLYCPPGEDPNTVVDLYKLLEVKPTIPPSSATESGFAPKKGQEIDTRTFTRPKRHSVSGSVKKAEEKKMPHFTPHAAATVDVFKKPITPAHTPDYSELNKENLINMSPNLPSTMQKKLKPRLSEDVSMLENISFPHAFFTDLSLNETVTSKLNDNVSTEEEQTREALHFRPGSVSTPVTKERRTLKQINETPDVDTKEKDTTFDVITKLDETYGFSTSGTKKDLLRHVDQSNISSDNDELYISMGKPTSENEKDNEAFNTTFSLPCPNKDTTVIMPSKSSNILELLLHSKTECAPDRYHHPALKPHTGTNFRQMMKSVSCESIIPKKEESLGTPKKHDSEANLSSHQIPPKEEREFKLLKPVLKTKIITSPPLFSGEQEMKQQRPISRPRWVPPSPVKRDQMEPRSLKTHIRPKSKCEPSSLVRQGTNFRQMRKSVSCESIIPKKEESLGTPKKHDSEANLSSPQTLPKEERELKLLKPVLKTKIITSPPLFSGEQELKQQRPISRPRWVPPSPVKRDQVEPRSLKTHIRPISKCGPSSLVRQDALSPLNKNSDVKPKIVSPPFEKERQFRQMRKSVSHDSILSEEATSFEMPKKHESDYNLPATSALHREYKFKSTPVTPLKTKLPFLSKLPRDDRDVKFQKSSLTPRLVAPSPGFLNPVETRSSRLQKTKLGMASTGLQEGARALQKPQFSLKKLEIDSIVNETYVADEPTQEQPKEPRPSGIKPPSSSSRIPRGGVKTKIPKFRPSKLD